MIRNALPIIRSSIWPIPSRTGGQSGVDRAALDFAIEHNIPYCGWCPKGGMALQTACIDTRIKATVTSTMYDMSRVAGNGYFDSADNKEARKAMREAINAQR